MTNQPQQNQQTILAEMLATKYCHDLSGLVGALNNGVEFLRESDPDMREKAIELVEESTECAMARLMFYRSAFGVSSHVGEASLSELRSLSECYLKQSKANLNWPQIYSDSSPVRISHYLGKALLNMILIACNALIHGGDVSIKIEKEAPIKRLTVQAKGERIKVDDVTMQLLKEGVADKEVDARNVQPYYTYLLSEQLGGKFATRGNDSFLEIAIEVKEK